MKKRLKILNKLLLSVFLLSTLSLQAQTVAPAAPAPEAKAESADAGGEKIIYEYKKEDYFDFEALSVKGDLLTPGDLSSKAVKRVKFNSKDYVRKNFDDYIEDDLMEIY